MSPLVEKYLIIGEAITDDSHIYKLSYDAIYNMIKYNDKDANNLLLCICESQTLQFHIVNSVYINVYSS